MLLVTDLRGSRGRLFLPALLVYPANALCYRAFPCKATFVPFSMTGRLINRLLLSPSTTSLSLLRGEDRDYVDKVAAQLRADGVSVFYDKYEEADLWGKNLHTHLKDVYEKQARFTVMFISEHYRDKVWPNHERKATQERAFAEIDNEYILPDFFDETIEVPGLARTTGHISLEKQRRLLTLSRDSHLEKVPGSRREIGRN
jgi:hypothetical protein